MGEGEYIDRSYRVFASQRDLRFTEMEYAVPRADGPAVIAAVMEYRGVPWELWFTPVEAIMADHGGRPHWGKRHTRTHEQLTTLYPRWNDLLAVLTGWTRTACSQRPPRPRPRPLTGPGHTRDVGAPAHIVTFW